MTAFRTKAMKHNPASREKTTNVVNCLVQDNLSFTLTVLKKSVLLERGLAFLPFRPTLRGGAGAGSGAGGWKGKKYPDNPVKNIAGLWFRLLFGIGSFLYIYGKSLKNKPKCLPPIPPK